MPSQVCCCPENNGRTGFCIIPLNLFPLCPKHSDPKNESFSRFFFRNFQHIWQQMKSGDVRCMSPLTYLESSYLIVTMLTLLLPTLLIPHLKYEVLQHRTSHESWMCKVGVLNYQKRHGRKRITNDDWGGVAESLGCRFDFSEKGNSVSQPFLIGFIKLCIYSHLSYAIPEQHCPEITGTTE